MSSSQETDLSYQLRILLAEMEAGRKAVQSFDLRVKEVTAVIGRLVPAPEGGMPGVGPSEVAPQSSPIPSPPLLAAGASQGEDGEDILHIISHDLKEPLRGIQYFGQLLHEESSHLLGTEGREYLEYIQAATRRMARLLDDILALSRLRRAPLQWDTTDLQRLVHGACSDCNALIRSRDAVVEVEGSLPTVAGDPGRIQEVLVHLIKNAVLYSQRPVQITLSASGPAQGYYHIRVKDTGPGIEARFLDQIFGLFQRLVTWEEVEGTGAGLALVKLAISRHGGRIWVESLPGRGSTFIFTLPADIPSA